MIYVLSSFRPFAAHTASFFGHIARYVPSSADSLHSQIIRKSDKANFSNPPKQKMRDFFLQFAQFCITLSQISTTFNTINNYGIFN